MSSRCCLLYVIAYFLPFIDAFAPKLPRSNERSWTPARETGPHTMTPSSWSSRPTANPGADFGEIELFRRDDFTMGTNTCGFVSGYSSAPVTCVKESAYCTHDGVGNLDCCTGEYTDCTSTMFSSCLDFSASQKGACKSAGPRTICCWSESPSCYTLLFSTSATPGRIFSLLECQTYGGIDTLLATPPELTSGSTASDASSSSTSSTSSTSSPSSLIPSTTITLENGGSTGSSNSGGSEHGSSTPVGAIVGGTVGGVAVIALVGFLIFYLVIRNKRNTSGYQAPPHQQQAMQQQSPGAGSGFQQQMYYDPNTGEYKPYDYAGGYPTQPGELSAGPVSPGEQSMVSSFSQGPYPQQQQQVTELPTVGSIANRAELSSR